MTNTNETSIVLNNGKYTVVHNNGANLRALRHGEEWRSLVGDGLVLSMAQEIESLIEQTNKLHQEKDLLARAIESIAIKAGIITPGNELSGPQLLHLSESILESYNDKDLALEARIGLSKISSNIANEALTKNYSDDQEWNVEICRQGTGFNSVTVKAANHALAIEAADQLSGNLHYSEKNASYSYSATPTNVIVAKPSASKLKI